MELQQPIYRKVKIELKQPKIMCSGRKATSCYYRGKVIRESYTIAVIEFKYKGQIIRALYNKRKKFFLNSEYSDLHIKE